MRIKLNHILQKLLELLRLWPLSLAEKCRLTFGTAVLFILALVLLMSYIWMGQLTKIASLDAGRAKTQTLLRRHFQEIKPGEAALLPLNETGTVLDVNNPEVRWIRFTKENEAELSQLTKKQRDMVKSLKEDETNEGVELTKYKGDIRVNYVRIFKATEDCRSCHDSQGTAGAFSPNELIGAVVIQSSGLGSEIRKTKFMNLLFIFVAGLIGGTGAVVAFYLITQRVILRPIRQLRALVNNVAEGNLDVRSSIATRDEYEKLADAFNHMLDGLQASQEKLRQANIKLDDKIVELSERNIELFKANKLKGEFLANISHEFKTPLNAILGFAQVLREKPDTLKKDKEKRYAENIITSGNRLLNMINDLLDLAKTQAGKMELHIENTSVSQLCKGLLASFSLLTKEKKIKVKMQLAPDLPILSTDIGKVQQILYNFLSNAVKFTLQRGRIEIAAKMVDEKMIRFAVTDTGCGIAESDKKKIFEKFRQADGSITRESTGSGLGLTISSELAAMLAGSIGMESELDKGSTFWLDIPVTLTTEQERTE